MKVYSYKLLVTFLGFLVLFPVLAQAISISIANPLRATTFNALILAIVNIIFTIALALAPLMIIIAGFYFMTAAGDPAKIQTAKQIILWTLIGLLIILLSRGIITLFRTVFM